MTSIDEAARRQAADLLHWCDMTSPLLSADPQCASAIFLLRNTPPLRLFPASACAFRKLKCIDGKLNEVC